MDERRVFVAGNIDNKKIVTGFPWMSVFRVIHEDE